MAADTLRLVLWQIEWPVRGPGLQAQMIDRATARVERSRTILNRLSPDILVLIGLDWDADGRAAARFQALLAEGGLDLPHHASVRPVSGVPSGLDLDGNGRLGEARDALGWGLYPGQGAVHVLSAHPLGAVTNLTPLLWSDLPDNQMAGADLPEGAEAVLPLATTSLFGGEVQTASPFMLWATALSPPVFDGPEDRNGRRNADQLYHLATLPADTVPSILAGNFNQDPSDGEGQRPALIALLDHPLLTDPEPRRAELVAADTAHRGDPALDTVDWTGPGPLRVSYILPDRRLTVLSAGVDWPTDDPLWQGDDAPSRHRPVWIDLRLPAP